MFFNRNNQGRIDAVLIFDDHVIITEVKFSEEGDAEKLTNNAFKQIDETGYIERYKDNNRKITLLAVVIAGKDISCKMKY